MAETFLGPVIEKLTELLAEEVTLLKGVSKEVESLKDELKIIQPFLKDAEAKLEKGEVNDATREWLKQIREVGDRIEDVVDEHLYYLAKRCHEERGFVGSLRKAGNSVTTLKRRHDIADEIQDIKDSLCRINERAQRYGLRLFEQASSSAATNLDAPVIDPRLGSLFIEEDEFVGIDSISKETIRSLVEGPSRRSVISLVGEGGIGKTTLARKVYNDEVVRQHFECFAWITVSQSYNMEKVLMLIKNQICPAEEEPLGTTEALVDLLRQYLKTKRYVIVFDDVWKINFLEDIKRILPCNNKSDRIVITTRNMTIANDGRDSPSDPVQKLESWSQELAWELFCKKAFRFEFMVGCCPEELEPLSLKIVSKCQGLPLAIAAVAGLLSRKGKSKLEWQTVHDNLNYEFQKNPQISSVSKILSFSYHDLPYHLKSCFMYFGIFPEDFLIWEDRLYKLWIAEDFIKSRRDKEVEQVAKEYLSELIHRNLVSFEIRYGFERWCRVHDLIRDVILVRVDELCFCQIINENKLKFEGTSRRLSINGTTKDVLNLVRDNSKIRSIFFFNIDHELTESFLSSLFEKFKLLKVLDFEDAPLDTLPEEIGNLFNLKYLNMRRTTVKMVPKCIGKLQNLQTLNLHSTFVQELPIGIKKLRSLRHLSVQSIIFHDSRHGVRTLEGLGSLVELQTLLHVKAYPSTTDLGKELEKLRKLKCLSIIEVTPEIGKHLGASIEKMNQLEELYLESINEGDGPLDLKCISSPPPLLSYLSLQCQQQQLPDWISKLENLQGLDLTNSRLSSEPLKWLKDLSNLAFLCMDQAYEGEELHFEKGGFQKLKELKLVSLEGLKVVKIDRGALSLLEKLDFGPFPLMIDMPSDIQHLTNLKSLEINDMPREFVVGLQPDEGTHHWKIQHVPSVTFWFKSQGNKYRVYKLGNSKLLQCLKEPADQ